MNWFQFILTIILLCVIQTAISEDSSVISANYGNREGKVLSLFSMVRFQNGPCIGTTRNGTCYTSSECSSRGGTSQGSCAGSFGVCCVFELGCGSTSFENCTYFVQTATTSPTTPCTLTACKCSGDVCRMRLDFEAFNIASPNAASDARGDCTTDTFVASSPGNQGSPVICGYNTGQHMFLDTSDTCNELTFNTGAGDTTTSREWRIKITQYKCGDTNGGPPDCLQYFTSPTGKVASFNYRTDQTTVSSTAGNSEHLSNQCYTICFRQATNTCKICYWPAITNSFGVGLAITIADQAEVNGNCIADYLGIPGAVTGAAINSATITGGSKICGQFFTSIQDGTAAETVCTLSMPFRIEVKFNDAETVAAALQTALNDETAGTPAGNIGFYLCFEQSSACV